MRTVIILVGLQRRRRAELDFARNTEVTDVCLALFYTFIAQRSHLGDTVYGVEFLIVAG